MMLLVMNLKEYVMELKGELTIYKVAMANGMLDMRLRQYRMDVFKPKEFKGTRLARDMDNFLWKMKQCFQVMGIEDDATKPWVKQELSRQVITELIIAMTEVGSFIEFGLRKYKFESSKPKEMGNGGGNHEEDGNGNGENGGNGKPLNRKWKPNNRTKMPMKFFLCDGSHMNCPERSNISVISKENEVESVEGEALKFGSMILNSAKVKRDPKQKG
ncbi:hypothetical protein J1N35_038590 [Gossypium stocksii]|uniref:Uncharacterized protein n=1 Tax=Gossypium stocksii TaxID=47602 RepID=A0A9D3ZLZ5_9ROSI|nr:hypothetical protein J1N35_038590 [Gossypium stocksii]